MTGELTIVGRRHGGRGCLVILNYSYRGDAALDRSDVVQLAPAHGFDLLRLGTQEF